MQNSCDKCCTYVKVKYLASFSLEAPQEAKDYRTSTEVALLGLQKKTRNFKRKEQAGFSRGSCCRQRGFGSDVLLQCRKPFKIRVFVSVSVSQTFSPQSEDMK